jgi:hypothetical protein
MTDSANQARLAVDNEFGFSCPVVPLLRYYLFCIVVDFKIRKIIIIIKYLAPNVSPKA